MQAGIKPARGQGCNLPRSHFATAPNLLGFTTFCKSAPPFTRVVAQPILTASPGKTRNWLRRRDLNPRHPVQSRTYRLGLRNWSGWEELNLHWQRPRPPDFRNLSP